MHVLTPDFSYTLRSTDETLVLTPSGNLTSLIAHCHIFFDTFALIWKRDPHNEANLVDPMIFGILT